MGEFPGVFSIFPESLGNLRLSKKPQGFTIPGEKKIGIYAGFDAAIMGI